MHDRVEPLQLLDGDITQVDGQPGRVRRSSEPSTQSANRPLSRPVTSCPAAARIGAITVPR